MLQFVFVSPPAMQLLLLYRRHPEQKERPNVKSLPEGKSDGPAGTPSDRAATEMLALDAS